MQRLAILHIYLNQSLSSNYPMFIMMLHVGKKVLQIEPPPREEGAN